MKKLRHRELAICPGLFGGVVKPILKSNSNFKTWVSPATLCCLP